MSVFNSLCLVVSVCMGGRERKRESVVESVASACRYTSAEELVVTV